MLLPAGHIRYWAPGMGGYVEEFGHAQEWHPTEDWLRWDCEWIEPLGALAPRPYYRPEPTLLSQFNLTAGWNNLLREVTLSGNPPVKGIQFYDGRAYAGGLPFSDTACALSTKADWPPQWALYTTRNAPPPSQGCGVYIMLAMGMTHRTLGAGQVTIALPLANEDYSKPFLHWVAPVPESGWSVLEHGEIVLEFGGSTSATQAGKRDVLLFQSEEIWRETATGKWWAAEAEGRTFVGTHFLLRTGDSMATEVGSWAHWWTPDIRLATGPLFLTIGGAVQSFALAPVVYGGATALDTRTAYTEPDNARAAPSATHGTWATAGGQWLCLPTWADDWNIGAAASPRGRKPLVSMEREAWAARHRRPILWQTMTETPAKVAVAAPEAPSGGWPLDTRTTLRLRRMSVTLNGDWKGAKGTGEFRAKWPDVTAQWAENGVVEAWMGLQGGTGAYANQRVLTGRIAPDGLKRRRTGGEGGRPAVNVEFGDLYATALENKTILDMRQAGGRALLCTEADPCTGWTAGYCWLHAVGNRLGLPYASVSHWTSGAVIIIPAHESILSIPALSAPDGMSWQEHIAAVEATCGVRVTFGKAGDGKLSADLGPPEYEHGVSEIALVLDEAASSVYQMLTSVQADRGGERWRNMVKLRVSTASGDVEWYWVEPEADRLAGIVDDWPAYYQDDDARSITRLWRRFLREGYRCQAGIMWTMPLCPGLRPDMFVQLDVTGIGMAYGSVHQIVEHTMMTDAYTGQAESQLLAVQVYPQPEAPY